MRKVLIFGLALVAVVILTACASATPTTVEKEVPVTVEVPVEVEVTRVVEVTAVPVVQAEAPYIERWLQSAHAAAESVPFTYWESQDPAQVPAECAKCHSSTGYQDFVGADGSAAGTVENPAPLRDVVTCQTCHNDATQAMTSVTFPSGATVDGLGSEARCLQCHQGRASRVQVEEAIAKAGVTDDDAVSEDLGFTNIHYFAAGVSRYGTQVKGGYEYDGKAYDVRFEHVEGVQSCADCHDSHSLQVKVDTCAACHAVSSVEDLKDVRMQSSEVDYDGDGDVEEGVYYEIEGSRERLYAGIQAYASEVAGKGIGYNAAAYPYFFIDTNGDGQIGDDEAKRDNRYNAWTPRLTKAAYNYQVSLKDPGAFAHGGKYILELLYDSLEDLNVALGDKAVDMTGMNRTDAGHFAGSEMPFRDWDDAGAVPATCAKCHSAEGLPQFLANGANVAVPLSNGFRCDTCHSDLATYARYAIKDVRFPSGKVLTFGENADANLCITCHQGRESTVSVDNAIKGAGVGDNEVSDKLRFRNIHYFAAGATLFGGDALGGYQYNGQTYAGLNRHGDIGPQTCTDCHETHELEVKVQECQTCHRVVESAENLREIRAPNTPDYDGDGDVDEGVAGEITTLQEALYAAIQKYAAETAGTALAYSAGSYPYFFTDTDANGVADEAEAVRENGYATWTPALLRAAYNYQYSQKDPGAFAHNSLYVVQLLYDSLKFIGADVSAYTRP